MRKRAYEITLLIKPLRSDREDILRYVDVGDCSADPYILLVGLAFRIVDHDQNVEVTVPIGFSPRSRPE